jgi:hypothetical protein
MFTTPTRLVAATIAGTTGAVLLLSSLTGGASASAPVRPDMGKSEIAAVRAATAEYHDPAAAIADGFVPTDACSEHPELGGMGLHYVNPGRLMDPAIVATEPEVLLYEPTADGGVRLVGVEWFSVDPDQDLTTDDGRPTVLGQAFDGPMEGHEPGMPVHFDLHLWLWKHNPAGAFAAWNPAVTCTP